ncbi:MAG: hypothetical protein ACKOW9_04415 [Candidatus Paceibacterota bacterium]
MHYKKISAYRPYKRLVTLSLLLVPLTYITYINNSKTWYVFKLSAENVYVKNSFKQVKYVSANEEYNAFDLMSPDMVNTITGPVSALNGLLGLPMTSALMCLGALLLVVGAIMRLTVLSVLAAIVINSSRRTLDTMRSLVENPNFGGDYMFPTQVVAQQYLLLILALLLSLMVVAQTIYINYKNKVKSDTASTFDVLTSAYTTVFSRINTLNGKIKEKV